MQVHLRDIQSSFMGVVGVLNETFTSKQMVITHHIFILLSILVITGIFCSCVEIFQITAFIYLSINRYKIEIYSRSGFEKPNI